MSSFSRKCKDIQLKNPEKITIFVGPEGGWSTKEEATAKGKGFKELKGSGKNINNKENNKKSWNKQLAEKFFLACIHKSLQLYKGKGCQDNFIRSK